MVCRSLPGWNEINPIKWGTTKFAAAHKIRIHIKWGNWTGALEKKSRLAIGSLLHSSNWPTGNLIRSLISTKKKTCIQRVSWCHWNGLKQMKNQIHKSKEFLSVKRKRTFLSFGLSMYRRQEVKILTSKGRTTYWKSGLKYWRLFVRGCHFEVFLVLQIIVKFTFIT